MSNTLKIHAHQLIFNYRYQTLTKYLGCLVHVANRYARANITIIIVPATKATKGASTGVNS